MLIIAEKYLKERKGLYVALWILEKMYDRVNLNVIWLYWNNMAYNVSRLKQLKLSIKGATVV